MSIRRTLLCDSDAVGSWTLVRDESTVEFKSKTLWELMTVKGTFSDISGEGQVTAAGAVFGRLSMRADSLKSGIRKRDAHLRSPDFFDSENHPEIRLVVTAATMSEANRMDLRCRLTIKAITEMVNLPVTVEVGKDDEIRIAGRTCLDRAAFGVSGNIAGMMGSITEVSGRLLFRRDAP